MARTPDDYHELTEIQIYELDQEIQLQPRRMSEICREHVRAKSRLARAERELKKLRARKSSEGYKELLEKEKAEKSSRRPTGDQVNAWVDSDDDIEAKNLEVEAMKEEVDDWAGQREVWSQRSHMFKELTRMLSEGLVRPDVMRHYNDRENSMAEYDKTREELAAARRQRRAAREQF